MVMGVCLLFLIKVGEGGREGGREREREREREKKEERKRRIMYYIS